MSQRALNPDQFRFIKAQPRSMEAQKDSALYYHQVHVPHLGSSMLWHPKTGEIKNIGVPEQFQRQGVATSMLGHARQVAAETRGVRPPRHSSDRTEAGDAWARSTGDRLPKRRQPTVAETESHFRDMGVEVR